MQAPRTDMQSWLPTTRKELEQRGWDWVDVILFSGDAYVDHPSFGVAVIGRVLEAEGLRVAIVPQPNWRDDLRDFKKLGRPRLFFGVSAGAMDSMVNHYTANKRLRSDDAYTPDFPAPRYPLRLLARLFASGHSHRERCRYPLLWHGRGDDAHDSPTFAGRRTPLGSA